MMKKICSFALTMAMLVTAIPASSIIVEAAEETISIDDSVHVEVVGDDPVYPEAPDGYSDYDDYRDSTGWVHDTEFYYDQEEQLWYYYVTNSSEIWSSDNLVNWTRERTNRNGNAWAPCIIKLREPVEYKGASYTYALWDSLSTFGTRESWIRLWLSNSPKEGFVYAGDTVTSLLDDGKAHNAIDPSVFYDNDGRMWMTYGSFFGGLFIIELNPETCMPMNPDELPGTRLVYRSYYGNSIEGPTIIYNPDTEYYYLNVSYGSLDHTYNVRIGRSKNVEGPYYDYNGLPMNNTSYSAADQIGTKITTPYCFDPDKGWYSTGHSSFLYNPDTGEYFLSHNARQENITATRLNIRKIYWTEDGWPVVSPELYVEGETEQKIPTRCIPGTYEFIEMLRADLGTNPMSAVKRSSSQIELNEDHSITGDYKGVWIQTGDNTLKLELGGVVYTVTIAAAWDWENWKSCLVFTGLSEAADTPAEGLTDLRSGLGIWGKKVQLTTNVLADFTFDSEETGFTSARAVADGTYTLVEHNNGNAIYLDGVDDFLEVTARDGSSLLAGQDGLTVSMQVRRETGGVNWLFYTSPTTDTQQVGYEKYLGILDRGTTVLAERYNNNGSRPATATGTKTGSGWEYLTVVYRANETVIYVNGQEIARQSSDYPLSDILTDTNILYIGKANWQSGEYFKGYIDNYTILDRPLSSWEVKETYANMSDEFARVNKELAMFTFDAETSGFTNGYGLAAGDHSLQEHDGGNALYLDGVDDFLEVTTVDGTPLLYGETEFTVSFQAKPETSDTNWAFYAAPNADAQPYLQEKYVGVLDRGGIIRAERYNNTGIRPAYATASVPTDDWYYLTVVQTEKETILYVNGEEAARQNSDYSLVDILGYNSVLYIGKANWKSGEYYKGLIDNYTIRNYALTAEEVKTDAEKYLKKEHVQVLVEDIFEDVDAKDWYRDSVQYVYDNEIMTGMTATTFAPFEPLTRAQFALILHRIEGEPEVISDKKFDDVSANSWYADAVLWAYEAGVITGYANTNNFGPHDMIMREQMAVMMYRYAKVKNPDIAAEADLSVFTDAGKVGSYAEEAMKWAVGNGIITGKSNGTALDPRGNTIRAEAAVVIDRFMTSR